MIGKRYIDHRDVIYIVQGVYNDPPSPGYKTVVAFKNEQTNLTSAKPLSWFKANMTIVTN
jgi:hypothetical protein